MVTTHTRQQTREKAAVLAYITTYIYNHGYPPSIREIAEGAGISSTSQVHKRLEALERCGLLKVTKGIARGISLP